MSSPPVQIAKLRDEGKLSAAALSNYREHFVPNRTTHKFADSLLQSSIPWNREVLGYSRMYRYLPLLRF